MKVACYNCLVIVEFTYSYIDVVHIMSVGVIGIHGKIYARSFHWGEGGGVIGVINSYYYLYIGHRQIPPRSLIYRNDYKTNYI